MGAYARGKEHRRKAGRAMNKTICFWMLAAALSFATGCMTIHKAANKGNLAGVKAFLMKGTSVDARDAYGRTPLMYMVSDPESVRYLLAQGADANARDDQGETPLMKAAWVDQLPVVRLLVETGADVNARNAAGETPLMRAVRNLDVVKYLVEQGADLNAKDGKGESVLLKASTSGRVRTVQYLKQKGAAVAGDAQ